MRQVTLAFSVPLLILWLVLSGKANQQSTEPAQEPYNQYNQRVGNRLFVGAEEATGTNEQIEQIKEEVMKAAEMQADAFKRKDRAGVLASLADDWAYTNERGEVYGKEEWVTDMMGPNLRFPYAHHIDIMWHVFGDSTVVETGRSESILIYKDKISHGPRRETAVFAKVNGHWVQASLHVGFPPAEQRDFTFPLTAIPR
ncbi:MAG TPA: nuclear transport factor 2 family protein [Candidatus Acidoferrales bacterium]|jgi:hypothetical protein|nr:nuclear transport factor 2 family protein [Candidatus Acidoferrales bacterium]